MVKSNYRMRFAPTPSGFLHAGNLWHMQALFLWKQQLGAEMVLRIDDLDFLRRREEYVQGVFNEMAANGYSSEIGPRDAKELRLQWSQVYRIPLYFGLFRSLVNAGWVYRCSCSRKDLQHRACSCGDEVLVLEKDGSLYVDNKMWNLLPTGKLTDDGFEISPIVPLPFVLKFRVASMGGSAMGNRRMEDFVLWRRDMLPAYQLASLADDILLGITHVFRGDDLLESTQRQLLLNLALSTIWQNNSSVKSDMLALFHVESSRLDLDTKSRFVELAQPLNHPHFNREIHLQNNHPDISSDWKFGEHWVENPYPNELFQLEKVQFLHHPLLLDDQGVKLSKSGYRGDE